MPSGEGNALLLTSRCMAHSWRYKSDQAVAKSFPTTARKSLVTFAQLYWRKPDEAREPRLSTECAQHILCKVMHSLLACWPSTLRSSVF